MKTRNILLGCLMVAGWAAGDLFFSARIIPPIIKPITVAKKIQIMAFRTGITTSPIKGPVLPPTLPPIRALNLGACHWNR